MRKIKVAVPSRISSPSDNRPDVTRLCWRYVPFLLPRIFQRRHAIRHDDPRMVPRDANGVALNGGVRRPADHVGAFEQDGLPVVQNDRQPVSEGVRARRGRDFHDVADKTIAESIHRAQVLGIRRGVAERPSNFGDQAREVRLLDERRRPQALLQLGLRHRARPVDEQHRQ